MTHPQIEPRARIGALLLCCVLLSTLAGCSLWNRTFHRSTGVSCSDKPFRLNTDNHPVLKVPEGMSAPDTRNAIRIPDLSDHPERVRSRNEPCLAEPPNYFATPLKLDLPAQSKPKHWWQFWRKRPPPAPPAGVTPAPAAPALPAPAAPAAPAPASPAPAPSNPATPSGDATPK